MKKRVICSVLVAVMLLSMSALPISAGTTDFNDVFGHWAQADIMTLVDKGIISGYPDGSFQPDKSVTRAEFIKILAAALQLPQAAPA
ncbi:MAG: S-layer homology domain-containing protein, partial [bacterium]